MRELLTAIPDVEALLALEPEELGQAAVPRQDATTGHVQSRPDGIRALVDGPLRPRVPPATAVGNSPGIGRRWSWLEAQGLIVPAESPNGRNGWRVLSRRARKFENAAEFANYAVARRLPKETLHPRISGPVWMSFMRGEFDTAAFQAMKAVEVAVCEAAGFAASDLGTKLMRGRRSMSKPAR